MGQEQKQNDVEKSRCDTPVPAASDRDPDYGTRVAVRKRKEDWWSERNALRFVFPFRHLVTPVPLDLFRARVLFSLMTTHSANHLHFPWSTRDTESGATAAMARRTVASSAFYSASPFFTLCVALALSLSLHLSIALSTCTFCTLSALCILCIFVLSVSSTLSRLSILHF